MCPRLKTTLVPYLDLKFTSLVIIMGWDQGSNLANLIMSLFPFSNGQLIRSMVKRKIHPDLERKINEGIGSNNPSKIGATLGGPRLDHNLTAEPAGNESRSLLDGMKSLPFVLFYIGITIITCEDLT